MLGLKPYPTHTSTNCSNIEPVLGLDPNKYLSHSLRIGGTTVLFAAGLPGNAIKLFGRWKTDCYHVYTRMDHSLLKSLSTMIAEESYVF